MGEQPGDEELHPDRQHLPLLGALPGRLLQGLQRQAVSEGGRGAHHFQPGAGLIKGVNMTVNMSVSPNKSSCCRFFKMFYTN